MLHITKIVALALLMHGMPKATRCQVGITPQSTLCNSLSKKAVRLRTKWCSGEIYFTRVKRKKRDDGTISVNPPLPEKTVAVEDTCKYNSTIKGHKECNDPPTGKINGFKNQEKGLELNVTFFEQNGCWKAKVSWSVEHSTNCTGYYIGWRRKESQFYEPWHCAAVMNKSIVSFILDPSKGWHSEKYRKLLEIAVLLLPMKTQGFSFTYRRFEIPSETIKDETITKGNQITTQSTKTIKDEVITEANQITTQATKTIKDNAITERSHNTMKRTDNKENGDVVLKLILSSVVIIIAVIIAFSVVYRARRTSSKSLDLAVHDPFPGHEVNKGGHYISYYNDNNNNSTTAIRIASWLKHKQINVIMDKFHVITSRKRVWCENQLSKANRVIMIVTPAYLRICKFGENIDKEKKHDCFNQQLTWNEIIQIRHEMMEKPLATDRYVVVLVETDSNELPFWMRGLKIFKYNERYVLSENILKELKS